VSKDSKTLPAGEPLPAFDTTLFIVTALVIALAGVIVAIATKGRLGY
jgi:hypothetical protein